MKKLTLLIAFLLVLAISVSPHFALAEDNDDTMMGESVMEDQETMMQDDDEMEETMEEAEEMMEVKVDVSSYELFWPVTAGKTRGDSLYFLKTLKEKVRGLLIFGDVKDADYQALIATKRVVEAEKLLINGDSRNALKTLEDAREALNELSEEWEDVDNKSEVSKAEVDEINNKLNNLEAFLPRLAAEYEGSVEEINSTLNLVKEVNEKI